LIYWAGLQKENDKKITHEGDGAGSSQNNSRQDRLLITEMGEKSK
jgi:hypothetical protein